MDFFRGLIFALPFVALVWFLFFMIIQIVTT